jgi:hypothetical protein
MSTNVIKLSQLLDLRVEDEDAAPVGRLQDVRVRRVDGERAPRAPAYVVDALILRARGPHVRFGFGHGSATPGQLR